MIEKMGDRQPLIEAVICAETAHINADECGAPERFAGCKLIDLPTIDGIESKWAAVWQEQGTYAFDSYPASAADGTTTGTYPDAWYAISTGQVDT